MEYQFNYEKYIKRCSAIEDYGVSRPLKCFPLTNGGTDYLFPDTVPPLFEFDKNNNYETRFFEPQKLQWAIKERDLNLEVVALDRGNVPMICIDHANNHKIIAVFLKMENGVLEIKSEFTNSSLEQFAESLMFYREFNQQGWENSNAVNSGFDSIITSEMVLKFFENLNSIDMEATKKYSFWKYVIYSDILCGEMEKMGVHSHEKIPPAFYESDIWKALNYN